MYTSKFWCASLSIIGVACLAVGGILEFVVWWLDLERLANGYGLVGLLSGAVALCGACLVMLGGFAIAMALVVFVIWLILFVLSRLGIYHVP